MLKVLSRKTVLAAAFALAATAAATAVVGPAVAHHSGAVYFDMNSQITVEGVVDEFVFKAPHAVLKFIVVNKDGEQELWRAETLPANLLFRRGWRFNMFEKGEKIKVTGNPAKEADRHALELQAVVADDGTVYKPFD
jgi:hypothetical protein